MRFKRGVIVLSSLIVVASAMACGPSGPKIDPVVEAVQMGVVRIESTGGGCKFDFIRCNLNQGKTCGISIL